MRGHSRADILLRYILIHKNKVAYAPGHYKKMKDFVGTEIFVHRVKNGQLQRVDHAAHRVDDTARKKPQEGAAGQRVPQGAEYAKAYPSHGDVDEGRKPLRASDPADIDDHADDGDPPYDGKQRVAEPVAQNDETDGCVGTGNQNKDHHVVQLAKYFQNIIFYGDAVVKSAGSIKRDHASDKYRHGDKSDMIGADGGLY